MRQTAPLFAAPRARFKRKGLDHGQHIYAYRHVYTNQVLYSLTQTLDGVRSLRQLPDLGANTPQATGRIRRDMWRPLFSVSFPSPTHGSAQGYDAYWQLREWRKLHEHYWTPPASLSQPYTEEQKEELKERLEKRGGSKKETVYDLIKREKKKIRRAEVMDQKATSIADLAAVLIQQDKRGVDKESDRAAFREIARLEELRDMLELSAEADRGGLASIDRKVRGLQPYLERREGWRIEDGATLSQRQARRKLYRLEIRKARMLFASGAVANAQRMAEMEERVEEVEQQIQDELASLAPAEDSQQDKVGPEHAGTYLSPEETRQRIEELSVVLESIKSARAMAAEGDPVEILTARIESQRMELQRIEEESTTLPPPLTEKEITELRDTQAAYQGALHRTSLLPRLEDGPEIQRENINLGSIHRKIEKRLYQIQQREKALQQMEAKRLAEAQGREPAQRPHQLDTENSPEIATLALEKERLNRNKRVCEQLLPGWGPALEQMQKGKRKVVVQWINTIKRNFREHERHSEIADLRRTIPDVIERYTRVLAAVQGVEIKNTPNADEWIGLLRREIRAQEKRLDAVMAKRRSLFASKEKKAENRALLKGSGEKTVSAWDAAEVEDALPTEEGAVEHADRDAADHATADPDKIERTDLDGMEIATPVQGETGERAAENAETDAQRQADNQAEQDAAGQTESDADSSTPNDEASESSITAPSAKLLSQDQAPDYSKIKGPNYYRLLPSFPPTELEPDEGLFRKRDALIEKARAKKVNIPVFTLEGVTVRWNDILDAEFAEAWPEEVVHERMGTVRFTAPRAVAEEGKLLSIDEVQERKLQQSRMQRKESESLVKRVAQAVVAAVQKGKGNADERKMIAAAERVEGYPLKIPPPRVMKETFELETPQTSIVDQEQTGVVDQA